MIDQLAGRILWVAYERLAMLLGLGAFALICLVWSPFAWMLQVLPRFLGQPLGRLVIRAGFRGYLWWLALLCGCRFELDELDRLRGEGPLILAANHPSLLDAVLVLSRLPNTVCVVKATLLDNPLYGAAARLARFLRNDSPLALILDAREELGRGAKVLIFPEGTRTTRFPINSCLASTGLLARQSRMAVQTLLIELSTPYLGKEWPLFRRPRLPLTCRVRLGRRFDPPANVGLFAAELEEYFRGELVHGHVASAAGEAPPALRAVL